MIEAMIDEYSLVNLSTAVSDEGFSIAYDSSLNRLNINQTLAGVPCTEPSI